MHPTPDDLHLICRATLDAYGHQAEGFWLGTKDHDVSQNVAALLQCIQGPPPFDILDLGCGPGRDLKTFTELGHRAIGLEGCAPFAQMARAHSGCEVLEQSFVDMKLPEQGFDGIFANASLFHVPSAALAGVLRTLHTALKPQGVLLSSNPRGQGEEGWSGERYAVYHDLQGWRSHVSAAGFEELQHYYRPAGLPREQQPWLVSVWRKRSDGL